tara:strand:- start:1763 stop:2608 length:846 start_codon:yes stop_codon:yes gene_type:complete
LIDTTEDYPDKDIIIIDNASKEKGTQEYLEEKESAGIKVIRREERDPKNEFFKAVNLICENSMDSDFIAPLQGDSQFIARNWLDDYLSFFSDHIEEIGALSMDAQRKSRNARESFEHPSSWFVYSKKRASINGGADVIYSRKIIDLIYPWSTNNQRHESNRRQRKGDGENDMLRKSRKVIRKNGLNLNFAMPIIPAMSAICTDLKSGGNARVKGDDLIGDYWPPKSLNYKYYKINEYENLKNKFQDQKHPVGKEDIVTPIGFNAPLDRKGNWIKKPIKFQR